MIMSTAKERKNSLIRKTHHDIITLPPKKGYDTFRRPSSTLNESKLSDKSINNSNTSNNKYNNYENNGTKKMVSVGNSSKKIFKNEKTLSTINIKSDNDKRSDSQLSNITKTPSYKHSTGFEKESLNRKRLFSELEERENRPENRPIKRERQQYTSNNHGGRDDGSKIHGRDNDRITSVPTPKESPKTKASASVIDEAPKGLLEKMYIKMACIFLSVREPDKSRELAISYLKEIDPEADINYGYGKNLHTSILSFMNRMRFDFFKSIRTIAELQIAAHEGERANGVLPIPSHPEIFVSVDWDIEFNYAFGRSVKYCDPKFFEKKLKGEKCSVKQMLKNILSNAVHDYINHVEHVKYHSVKEIRERIFSYDMITQYPKYVGKPREVPVGSGWKPNKKEYKKPIITLVLD